MRFSGLAVSAAALTLAGLISASEPAQAASAAAGLAPLNPLALEQSMVEKSHDWHRRCRRH